MTTPSAHARPIVRCCSVVASFALVWVCTGCNQPDPATGSLYPPGAITPGGTRATGQTGAVSGTGRGVTAGGGGVSGGGNPSGSR